MGTVDWVKGIGRARVAAVLCVWARRVAGRGCWGRSSSKSAHLVVGRMRTGRTVLYVVAASASRMHLTRWRRVYVFGPSCHKSWPGQANVAAMLCFAPACPCACHACLPIRVWLGRHRAARLQPCVGHSGARPAPAPPHVTLRCRRLHAPVRACAQAYPRHGDGAGGTFSAETAPLVQLRGFTPRL